MADPLRHPETKRPATPRWMRVAVILGIVLVLIVVVLLLTLGGHEFGPGGRH